MATPFSGFEGFEKRLELRFTGSTADLRSDLRSDLPIPALIAVLSAVQCTIVSAVGNRHFDAYVLSESSLFVYPNKIIIKTCGTTQLLNSIPSLLPVTSSLGLRLSFCRYSRGSFIFPKSQPFPHSSFPDEVSSLHRLLPHTDLPFRKSRVLPSNTTHSWHVYSASSSSSSFLHDDDGLLTLEVCMTDLNRKLAAGFYRNGAATDFSGDDLGAIMTDTTGIQAINPRALVCGFAFDPCGYSMNGLHCDRYSTIHVTPEDGYSYASFECVERRWGSAEEALARAVRVFRPGTVLVSVCGGGDQESTSAAVERAMELVGFKCESCAIDEFPGTGVITYQTFSANRGSI